MLALHLHCTTCDQSVGYIPQGTSVLADTSLSDASQKTNKVIMTTLFCIHCGQKCERDLLLLFFAFQQNNELPKQEDGSWKCKHVPYTVCYNLDHLTGQVLDVRRFRPFRMAKIYKK
jgi:hypothetical protein